MLLSLKQEYLLTKSFTQSKPLLNVYLQTFGVFQIYQNIHPNIRHIWRQTQARRFTTLVKIFDLCDLYVTAY